LYLHVETSKHSVKLTDELTAGRTTRWLLWRWTRRKWVGGWRLDMILAGHGFGIVYRGPKDKYR